MRRVLATVVLSVVALVAVLSYRSPKVANGIGSFTTTASSGISYITGPSVKAVQPGLGWVFGVVRVQIAVHDGRLMNVVYKALPPTSDTGPAGSRSSTAVISSLVAPILRREALRSQGLKVATFTGATYTVDAFRKSLQAALHDGGL